MGKQDETTPKKEAPRANMSRKHLFALWGTLITVLGTSVVPKIIDVLSDRPSVTDVQDIIAEQTKALTESVNKNIDRLDKHDEAIHDGDKCVARVEGRAESLQEVVRDCCTRRVPDITARLSPTVKKPVGVKPSPPGDATHPAMLVHSTELVSPEELIRRFKEKLEEEKADEAKGMPVQQKLPEFNPKWIQQKAE